MVDDNPLLLILLFLISQGLWLRLIGSPALVHVLNIAQALGKASGVSPVDVLWAFAGFLATRYIVSRRRTAGPFARGRLKPRLTIILATASDTFAACKPSALRLIGNTVAVLLNMRGYATGIAASWGDSLGPAEIPEPTLTDMARAVFYAVVIRECLPSMMGSVIGEWTCNIAGLLALVATMVPSLIVGPNAICSISLEPSDISLQDDKTLVQTPSPNWKKKIMDIVDRLPSPARGRLPRLPRTDSPTPAPMKASVPTDKSREDPVIEEASEASLSLTGILANNADDNLLDEQNVLGDVSLPDDDDDDLRSPRVWKGKAKEDRNEDVGANDTFSLADVLPSGAEDNLLDVSVIHDSVDGIYSEEPVPTFPPKVSHSIRKSPIARVERDEPVAGPSNHPDALRSAASDDKQIYTSRGWFSLSKMPYELFSPASMKASEVASTLLPADERLRCAEWRDNVARGEDEVLIEKLIKENDEQHALLRKFMAHINNLTHGQNKPIPETPPRIPEVNVLQASPSLSPDKICHQFPAFLNKASPITLDNGASSGLKASESIDSMYDPEYPGLDGKKADKYENLITSDWPPDFPTQADTSDEWKLTQEMIDFWAAYKAKKEAENPTPPLDMDMVSMIVDDGGEMDRSFADFEPEGDYKDDEQCLPGDSRLKCVGWRYEVVAPEPQPPKERKESLVDIVGNGILHQMQPVYDMYGPPRATTVEVPSSPSPPSSPSCSPPCSPPKPASPPPAAALEPAPVPVPAKGPRKSMPPPRPSTNTAAPTTRVLRPRPSAPVKMSTALPATSTGIASKLRPRASIPTTTSRAPAVAGKVVPRPSLPAAASSAPSKVVPPKPRQSLAPTAPKAAPRHSLPPPQVQSKAVKRPAPPPPPPPRAPLSTIKTNVPRTSLPAPTRKPSLAQPSITTNTTTTKPKVLPRPSLSRLPAPARR